MNELFIFDVDDTLINTKACIKAVLDGEVIFKVGTKVFNAPESAEQLLRPGMTWDFSEFESLEQIVSEQKLPAFESLKALAEIFPKQIYIITARQNRKMLHDWLFMNGMNLPYENIRCFDSTQSNVAAWKAQELKQIIKEHSANEVHIWEDDANNRRAMRNVCKDLQVDLTIERI